MNISILSRTKIQKLIHSNFPKNTAVISFYGEGEKPVYFPEHITYLRLYIDDYGGSVLRDPDNYHIDDFRLIAKFVHRCYQNNMDIICQCEAGVSRCAGTAAAILEYFEHKGLSIFADYRYSKLCASYKYFAC